MSYTGKLKKSSLYLGTDQDNSQLLKGLDGQFLGMQGDDVIWRSPPSGGGDVVGISPSLGGDFPIYEDITGKLIKSSGLRPVDFLNPLTGISKLSGGSYDGKVAGNYLLSENMNPFIFTDAYIFWDEVISTGNVSITISVGFSPVTGELLQSSYNLRANVLNRQATHIPSKTKNNYNLVGTRFVPLGTDLYVNVPQAATAANSCQFSVYLIGFYL